MRRQTRVKSVRGSPVSRALHSLAELLACGCCRGKEVEKVFTVHSFGSSSPAQILFNLVGAYVDFGAYMCPCSLLLKGLKKY